MVLLLTQPEETCAGRKKKSKKRKQMEESEDLGSYDLEDLPGTASMSPDGKTALFSYLPATLNSSYNR